MVRDVVQEREGPMKRKRFVFRHQNDFFSCVAAAEKRKLLRGKS